MSQNSAEFAVTKNNLPSNCPSSTNNLLDVKAGSDSLSSTTEIVQNVLERLLRKVHKTIRRRTANLQPKPTTKSPGWVEMGEIIPNFKIGGDLYEQLTFRESLTVSSFVSESEGAQPSPVGGLNLDVQPAKGNPFKSLCSEFKTNKFLVHLSSELDVHGNNGGSRITAWVDRHLQTLEEKRREYVRQGESVNEQNLYVSSQKNCYYGRHNKTLEKYHDPENAKNLICEGASFVLMRYLAITRHIGTFETTTIYINGDLCRNIYECQGPSSAVVNNQKLDVCKIYRTIIEECGIQHKSVTVLTLQGQIVKQDWDDCNFVLHINPLARVANRKPIGNQRLALEKNWTTDLELFSRYLDHKATTRKVLVTYMKDHEEIKNMIADYVTNILQLKPDDVIEFTSKYFLNFDPRLMPRSEYFERTETEADEDDDKDLWKYL